MSTNDAGKRLGDAVLARREYLAETQLDIYARGGPSNSTLTKIEGGTAASLSNATAKKLDRGLMWTPGSAMRVWRGQGEPGSVGAGTDDDAYVSSPGQTAERTATDADVLQRLDSIEDALRQLLETARRPEED